MNKASIMIGNKCLEEIKTINKRKEIISDDRFLLDEIIKVLENPLEGPLCVEINVNTDKLSIEEKPDHSQYFSWDDVDEECDWVAIDKDGFIASYIGKPDCDHEKKEWIPGHDNVVKGVKEYVSGSIDISIDNWKEMIWERPEKE